MNKLKKGDIVVRQSYGRDILFTVDRIIKTNKYNFAILKGITLRIVADAPLEDLDLAKKNIVKSSLRSIDDKFEMKKKKNNISDNTGGSFNNSIKKSEDKTFNRSREVIYTGKILHLDGDRKYSEKSARFYKQLGLNAIVKNIKENEQPIIILKLLKRYNPDILVITGHDGMIKNGTRFNDIYNYRNSRHFIETVKEARKWKKSGNDLVIFAGACQSYYEALMSVGANFASSPERVLIDFLDPLIIAEKVATTESNKYITIGEIAPELRDGLRGVGGIGAIGKKKIIIEK